MPTNIEYLDETWNFIGGCSPCSSGCTNCWACGQAAGRLKNHPLYKGLTNNGKWTGEIRLCSAIGRDDILEQPLRWKKPRRIGVQFMSDLFHPKVPFEFIDAVFFQISFCPQHKFQILTKRPKRMVEYLQQLYEGLTNFHKGKKFQWPFRNVYLGVSISTPAELWKLKEICRIPAAIRFVSFEPLLADLGEILLISNREDDTDLEEFGQHIDWVIIGCESGSKRRECKIEWVWDIVQQCNTAGVPVFVKQLSINGKVSRNPEEWPAGLRVQDYP